MYSSTEHIHVIIKEYLSTFMAMSLLFCIHKFFHILQYYSGFIHSSILQKSLEQCWGNIVERIYKMFFYYIFMRGNKEYFFTFMAMSLQFHIHIFFHILQKCKILLRKHCGKLNVEEYIYILTHYIFM